MEILLLHDTTIPDLIEMVDCLEIDLPNSGRVSIEAPYKSDGNTSPWFAWSFIPPFKYPLAYLVHDHLCEKARNNAERKKADLDYKWILKTVYNCNVRNHLGYFGVSCGRFYRRFKGYRS